MSIKKFILVYGLLFIMFGQAQALYIEGDDSADISDLPKQIIVKFRTSSELDQLRTGKVAGNTGLAALDALNQKYRIRAMEPLLPARSETPSREAFGQVFIIKAGIDKDLLQMARDYQALSVVEYAEPDYPVRLHETPNDSLYPYLWSLNNTGQEHHHVLRNYGNYNDELIMTSGLPDADIDAEEVYQNPPDQTVTVVVAIIDTGVDLDHPDLAANIWVNPREIPDNEIDDDHNGFIDDINGWDFAASTDPQDPGNNDPTDNYGHGTHIAGTIAAVANNYIGIAGITTDCKIMALSFDPLPLTSRIVNSIIYAADNGADVINMSFGLTYRSDLLKEAIEYAYAKGVIPVASSGNDGAEQVNYPAGYAETITVGATNDSDHVTTFSTYGDHVTICAPGLSILSLRADNTDMYGKSYPYEPNVHIVDTVYYMASGTSMSSPHVVGVAAQMRSVSPGLTPDATRNIIVATADDIIDPYGVGWNLPGYDRYSGHGRINLNQALAALPDIRARINTPMLHEIVSGEINITGLADGGEFVSYSLEYGEGAFPTEWTTITENSLPVTDDILATWNTQNLNGRYTLRLTNGFQNIDYQTVFVANKTAARIFYPVDGDSVSNFVAVTGDAYAPDFSSLALRYKAVDSTDWVEIYAGSVPIYNDRLGGWYLEDIVEGDYLLELSVYHDDSTVTADTIMVHILSIFSTDQAWRADLGAFPSIVPNYGDFDNDGSNEIVIGTSSGVKFFNTDGTEKTEGVPTFPVNNYFIPTAVGHLDDDGIDDIVAVGYDPPMLYGFPSADEAFQYYIGEFPPINNYSMTEHEFPKVFLRDIDSDGIDEIHFFNYNRDLSSTYLFKATGSLMHKFNYYSEYISVDLDNDGNDEIYACNRSFCLLRQIDPFTGQTKDSLLIDMNGSQFNVTGMSGFDIDNDLIMELVLYGFYDDFGYYIYALEDGLKIMDGWPHPMNMSDYIVPTMPVFGDLDGDHRPEYLTTFFDITASYVLAWHLDGSPYIPGNDDGLFAVTPEPSVMNMLLLADIDGDGQTDVVACADNDMFNTFEAQRIYAWDNEARMVSGFPIITVQDLFTNLRFTPAVGDINNDGFVDLVMTAPDSSAIFINFEDAAFDSCLASAPHWRYNRRLNNVGPPSCSVTPTDIADEDNRTLPDEFELLSNYPNPFNATTRISFVTPRKNNVRLEIYNLLGRKVKTLVDKEIPAGRHTVSWDGTDESGQTTASGIYFYVLKTDDLALSRKMTYLK